MVKIRFMLLGRSGQRLFRLVAIDSRFSRNSGKYLEYLGFYNPHTKETLLKRERIDFWIARGAQPTKTVKELLYKNKE